MTREETLKRVKSVVSDNFGLDVDRIKEESKLVADFHADDLDCIELIMGIEEEFGFPIYEEDAEKLTTVGEIVDLVMKKLTEPPFP